MPGPITIYLLDDHDAVRQALLVRLCSAPGMLIVGDAAEAETGLLEIEALRPDVALVETKRGDGRGLEIVHWIAHNGTGTQVIVLTSYTAEWERWAAHRAGAASYLLKDIRSPQLIEQIHSLVGAKCYPHTGRR